MSNISVPIDTLVPISKFSKGSASKEFAKVHNGIPVTVLKNSEPSYFIISLDDYMQFKQNEIDLINLRAKYEAESGIGDTFDSIGELMADLND